MAFHLNRSHIIAERLIKLRDYLYTNASPTHAVKIKDMLTYLANEGHEVEIKTVYSDLKTLEAYFGLEIEYDGRQRGYLLKNPTFEPYELRLIVNSIQAAKFVTQQEADRLTSKIMNKLADNHTRPSLNRRTFIPNRARSINEEAMKGLDTIYEAIAKDRKISYKYFNYELNNHTKSKVYRSINNSKTITGSPYEVSWEDGKFFINIIERDTSETPIVEIPEDAEDMEEIDAMSDTEFWDYVEEKGYVRYVIEPDATIFSSLELSHMEQIKILTDTRDRQDIIKRGLDLERRREAQNSLYKTKLKVSNEYISDIIDRFSGEVIISPIDENFFVATINQEPTPELYMWTREFSPFMEIIFPKNAESRLRAYFLDLSKDTEDLLQLPILSFLY